MFLSVNRYMENFDYKLPLGGKILKRRMPFKKMSPIQQKIYKRVYDPINGPMEFATHCCWVNCNGIIQYKPYDYQREMIFNMHNYQNIISLWSRQNGKTATSLSYLLWYAMAHPYKEILITSFGQESANKNLADVKLLYENCPNFLKCGVVNMNESTIRFDNKSKIFSKPTTGKSVRGLSPAYIYCDEFAFVGTVGAAARGGQDLQNEFYAAVSPALSASKGKIAITSTPITETDLFFRLWSGAIKKTNDEGIEIPKDYMIEINGEKYHDLHLFHSLEEGNAYLESIGNPEGYKIVEKDPPGDNGYISQLAAWNVCPTKNEEWARLERKKVGDERFEREFNCIGGESTVEVMDKDGIVIPMSIKDLYNYHMDGSQK